ncbi:2-hydroxy-3-oxopropionate reductase [Tepidimonas alkaliphilus]|uniref:2-hydroxy-3-oxopropionate reductase n=1 Tax=Tepidimonas alkaliphilus TaxID=2588942 RepID=A0A554WBI8_9BURK|nr:NAD(P)-dependent oxidoreductase [Tepidimonas alkaliphilus]TSE20937.1 2-hydroxy-3-oxopropionate reductase [Tepidimonas alkaliphilus]
MPTVQPKTAYEPIPAQRVAFIGLGVMGWPMAAHVALAGHEVTVYNRTMAKAEALAQAMAERGQCRVRVATTPREAAQGAAFVMTCVGADADLRSVILGSDGVLAGVDAGAVLVDHTTASAEVARELHAAAQALGCHFLDAPVSGGQSGAEQGRLTIMVGGDAEPFERARPVMMAYARAVTHLGPSGAGQLTKMVNQICIAGLLQGLAEALAFGQRAGLDMPRVLEVIRQGAAQSWQMDHRGLTMLEDRFDFGFAVDWMRKDLGLVLQEARRNGARLPVTALVDQFYADVQAMGGGRWDTSSLIRRLR